jgi:hypothetical protein
MSRSLIERAARTCVAASLFVSLGLAPAFCHPMFAPSHPASKFGVGRLGGRSGFDRPFRGSRENRWARAGNGWRRNVSAWNGAAYGGFAPWGGGFLGAPQVASAAPVVIGVPAPVPVPAMAPADDRALEGGCVIHMLKYDRAGNYIGEKQYSNC